MLLFYTMKHFVSRISETEDKRKIVVKHVSLLECGPFGDQSSNPSFTEWYHVIPMSTSKVLNIKCGIKHVKSSQGFVEHLPGHRNPIYLKKKFNSSFLEEQNGHQKYKKENFGQRGE